MSEPSPQDLLRSIPAVDRLLEHPSVISLRSRYNDDIVKRAVRDAVEALRTGLRNGSAGRDDCEPASVVSGISRLLEQRVGPKLRILINATGVVVHTNLGRSPLSQRAVDKISAAAVSYSNLEYDLDAGRRGERNAHLRALMEELTGAEAAMAVNNNAAAVFLALNTLAQGGEAIVSRGELIEIGGSFRIPDIMAQSGALLKAVGTTNRTHPKDYIEAIGENTALLLKVHPSNYRIEGFTCDVELDELVRIGKEHNVPTMMDLGSGCLVDLTAYGLEGETTVQEIVRSGVDLVTFSGDKLLGGPQAGIIVGKKELVDRLRTNHLARALRMDKLTLAGLEATLEEYVSAGGPSSRIPTLAMITRSADELRDHAEVLASSLLAVVGEAAKIEIVRGTGRVGGGALPMSDLPGPRVALQPRTISAGRLEQNLRKGDPPVIVLTKDDTILMDPRTLLHDQISELPRLVSEAMKA
jgi:L-seryl-tRNA(Ser) seleniumtransferase